MLETLTGAPERGRGKLLQKRGTGNYVEYRVKYDPLADALYIKVKEGEVSDSLELREGLIVDLDDKGEVIGIEILNFSKIKSVRKR